jgi:hypothetical protein
MPAAAPPRPRPEEAVTVRAMSDFVRGDHRDPRSSASGIVRAG